MEEKNEIKRKTLAGLFWTFAERIGAQLIGFVVSIVLARLLFPEEYGVISIVFVIINLCNVFVDSGFAQALIQNKDADDVDFSSVFYFSFVVSVLLYAGLFILAPYIARFYEMEILSPVIRVMGLRVVLASYSSVLKAKVSKEMQFKKFFFSSLGGTLFSAVVGITMAYLGFGVWALVAQDCVDAVIDTVILAITVKWHPKLVFSFKRMKVLFGFGWKVLLGGLVDTLYEDFRSLYIGKLYSSDDLAYYTRGKQFPNLLVTNINSSITSVLFPAISSQQGNLEAMKGMTRRAMKTSAYILTPMLCGLAAVAEPLVKLLLTEKWLPCVPFLQILCINSALIPLQSANVQAIYASGRSDIALKLNIIKKSFGFLMVLIFARFSVIAMAWAGVAAGFFSLLVNTLPNKKLLGYGFLEQMKDVLPCWLMSAGMMLAVQAVAVFNLPTVVELIVMVLVGVVAYVLLSVLFRVESFFYLLNTMKPVIKKFGKKDNGFTEA